MGLLRNGWGDRRDGSASVMGRSWAGGGRKKREDEESGGRKKKEVRREKMGNVYLMREERERVIKYSSFFYL